MKAALWRITYVMAGAVLGAALGWAGQFLASTPQQGMPLQVLAWTVAGVTASIAFRGFIYRGLAALAASLLSTLIIYVYYLSVSWHASVKILSLGVIGVLPLVLSLVFGGLSGVMVECVVRAVRG